jgi:hypothetical protein
MLLTKLLVFHLAVLLQVIHNNKFLVQSYQVVLEVVVFSLQFVTVVGRVPDLRAGSRD